MIAHVLVGRGFRRAALSRTGWLGRNLALPGRNWEDAQLIMTRCIMRRFMLNLDCLKFDSAKKVFEVSVRELAEDEGFARIGFGRGEGWHRLGLGAELHARVLKDRCLAQPDYRSEVHLQARCPVEEWTALVTGRLDGCAPDGNGGWLIEEFKSAYFPAQE